MEGDLVLPPGHKQRELISIHSLRMEGDLYPYGYSDASDISIHSLRMEGDTAYPDQTNQGYNFNPLPPHGGRRQRMVYFLQTEIFQSTPSAWRETVK